MATECLSMRELAEILRRKQTLARSRREVAATLQVGVGMAASGVRDCPRDGVGAVPAVSDLEAAGWVKVTPVGGASAMRRAAADRLGRESLAY